MNQKTIRITGTGHSLLTVLSAQHDIPMNRLVEALAQIAYEGNGVFGEIDINWDMVQDEFGTRKRSPKELQDICQKGLSEGMSLEEISETYDLTTRQIECVGTDIGAKKVLRLIKRKRLHKKPINRMTIKFLRQETDYSESFCKLILHTARGSQKPSKALEHLDWPRA